MSAAHGGQVLLSAATRELVAEDARDLGRHRLKDFADQVRCTSSGSTASPLRTIYNKNLPRAGSPLVGRKHEVMEVASLVRNGGGACSGGSRRTGKTRLALEARGSS